MVNCFDWNTVGSVVLGALITIIVAHLYYKKASRDLNVIARWLEESGVADIKFNRDEKGNLIGIVFKVKGNVCGKSELTGNPTINKD